jgi:hypothetical protein
MDYLTTCDDLTARLGELDPHDPLVAAALVFATQPWLKGIHDGPGMMRWGLFAGAVQAVGDRLWPEPPAVIITASPPAAPSPQLDTAVARLVTAVAQVLHRASRQQADATAWEYAAASAELLDAVQELL